jgi:hypothetical protein
LRQAHLQQLPFSCASSLAATGLFAPPKERPLARALGTPSGRA